MRLSDLPQDCRHGYVIKNNDGWYVCQFCAEELRYDPNKRPVTLADLYYQKAQISKMNSRIKNISKWLDKNNFPLDDELLVEFSSFINKFNELYPARKGLISKDYILYRLLLKRGYILCNDEDDGYTLCLPKMKRTLIQNEEICSAIFNALNWNF